MNGKGLNFIIFGTLVLVVAVIVNNHYSGIRSGLKENWGV